MANTLGNYNPLFYANEALIQLEKALGMANTIHRGYDEERRAFGKGDTITIRRPGTFTVQDAPSSAQDLNPTNIDLNLGYWKEVKFGLTDRELAFTTERIIQEHIRPAAYALADYIDTQCATLYQDVANTVDLNSTVAIDDLTDVYQALFDQKCPLDDNLFYMIDGSLQNGFQQLPAFNTANGAGQQGIETQVRGSLGKKFNMNIFANQNVQSHTGGNPQTTATVNGNQTGVAGAGTNTLNITVSTPSGNFNKGDIISVASGGVTYKFAVRTTTAAVASTALPIYPMLPPGITFSTGATVTITNAASATKQNLAYHRNAFAIAMAPLSEMGNELGAKIATITDPKTGLSIRARMFYEGNNSKVFVALDVLFGLKTLEPGMAVRCRRA